MTSDLRITGVHVPERHGRWSVRVDDGVIVAIEPSGAADEEIVPVERLDLEGWTLLPALVDGHLHLDKSLAGAAWQSLPQGRDWREKSRIGESLLGTLTDPALHERITSQAARLVENGTLAARTHATITPSRGLSGVEASLQVRDELAGVLAIQVVAFPQYGISADGMASKLRDALIAGCDVVGGNDPATYDGDIDGQLRLLFEVASRSGAPIDLHLHDQGHLGLFELDRLCEYTAAAGMQGRVVASHALALGELPLETIRPTLDRMAAAGVAVIAPANPDVAMPPFEDLEAAGVRCGIGTDAAHSVLPFGTGDVLRRLNQIAQRSIVTSDDRLARLVRRSTEDTAVITGIPIGRVEAGFPANLVAVRARNVAEAVISPPMARITIARGRVVTPPGRA